jgi:hypothetical protein
MAQTISASRGSQSYAGAETAVTLFTNSASGSSRVIINSMAMTLNTSSNGHMALFIRNAGGGYDIPFALYRNSVGAGLFYFLPGTVPVASWTQAGLSGVVMYGSASERTNGPSELRINWSSSNLTTNNISICPKSIWLGPSDAIIFRGYNDAGNGSNINWNFTCILET